jgi:predicted acyltransferase
MPRPRLIALDVFRGLTIAGMLLVNDPGSWDHIYPPLEHAAWFGWTPTDLIFPFFLFIVGVTTHLRRGALILLVGLLMTGFPYHQFYVALPGGAVFDSRTPHLDVAHWRLTGVLQRIALCYTIGALLTLRTTVKQQVIILVALLYGYWFAMTLLPVPGRGMGALVIGIPDGSLAAWIDRTILGTDHMWIGSRTWDPEGLLSTIPAIGTTLLGALTARWLGSERPLSERLSALFAAGALAMMTGLMWHWSFPIAKNIWTSSYVLFTGGCAAVSLATCMWIIDVEHVTWWTGPFLVYGLNPLAAFVASGFLGRFVYTLIRVPTAKGLIPIETAIYDRAFASWLPPRDASLMFAICWVLLFLFLAWLLYRKRIVIKL